MMKFGQKRKEEQDKTGEGTANTDKNIKKKKEIITLRKMRKMIK